MSLWTYKIIDSDGPEGPGAVGFFTEHLWGDRQSAQRVGYEAMCDIFDGAEPRGKYDSEAPEHDGKQYVPRARWLPAPKKSMLYNIDFPPGAYYWDVYQDGTFVVVVHPLRRKK